MSYLVLAIFLAGFGYLCWKNFRLALGLFVFLLPSYFIRFQIGPLPTTLLELCFGILFVIYFIKNRGQFNKKIGNWRWPIILFLIASTIGIYISPDRTAALGIWKAYFIEPILFFAVLVSAVKKKQDWQYIFHGLALSALAISILAIIQKFTGLAIPEAWAEERRVTAVFGYPNAVGLFLGPIIILAFSQIYNFFKEKKWLWSIFYSAVFALSAIAVYFSKTEAAWIAVAAGIFIFCLFKKELRLPAIIIAAILILIIGLTPVIRQTAIEKITLQDWSGHVRRVTWSESLDMLGNNFIFGAGVSGYPLKIIEYHRAGYIEIFQYPHNFILNFWSEIGLLGLFAWLWLVARAMLNGLKNHKEPFAAALIAIISAILIHGLVDVPYLKNDLAMMFWLWIALAFFIKNKKAVKRP